MVALVVLPLITAEILRISGNYVQQTLVNRFGMNSQAVFGGLGVVIHELAHLTVAVLFLHHINDFRLLEPRSYRFTGNLGYVNHSWSRGNLYESLGNFFIGLAPVFVCSEVLWLVHGYFFGNQILSYGPEQNWSGAFQAAVANVEHPFGPFGWPLLIYLILIVMIASTGYGLSGADMKNVYSGLPYWLVLIVIIYGLVTTFGNVNSFSELMWRTVVVWLTFLGRGLIYILTTWLVIKVASFF